MKVHRFFVGTPPSGSAYSLKEEATCHHMSRVLKLQPGERVAICDGSGKEYACDIVSISPKEVTLTIVSERLCPDAHLPHVTLCCALLKRENFEWVVQKAAEIGVARIVPLLTDRTIKTGLKHERLQKIAAEAAELSGRGRVPEIAEPMTMEAAMKTCESETKHLFFHTASKQQAAGSNETKSASCQLPGSTSVLWIGPEGGWSEREVAFAKQHGMHGSSLGSLVFRGETAAVVATYVAVHSSGI